MFCPECMQDLDRVPVGTPRPKCGSSRRSAAVSASAALVATAVMSASVEIGYNVAPGWGHQWRTIQRHLSRLQEQYAGVNMIGNLDVEDTVDPLLIALNHLYDWLHEDSSVSLSKTTDLDPFVQQHPDSLKLCRAYANTRKHMTRDRPGQLVAQITTIKAGPQGYAVTIGYGPWDQPTLPFSEIDALDLAQQCECDWRDLLNQRGIVIPI